LTVAPVPFNVIVLVPVPERVNGVPPARFKVGEELPNVNVEVLAAF
jgi:hypothetical protein